jgi:hypothetical protein
LNEEEPLCSLPIKSAANLLEDVEAVIRPTLRGTIPDKYKVKLKESQKG